MVKNNSDWSQLEKMIISIVSEATRLKNKYKIEANAPVSYCAIFCKTFEEFTSLTEISLKHGRLAKDTSTGPVFVVPPITTQSGPLRIIKIRKPDQSRLERGDADFTVKDYEKLKTAYLENTGFSLIQGDDFEMIELVDKEFDSRVYFSNPPVETQAGIRDVLTR